MKTAPKKKIIKQIEKVLANGVFESEEIDVTAEKIYKEFIEPLIRWIENENNDSGTA